MIQQFSRVLNVTNIEEAAVHHPNLLTPFHSSKISSSKEEHTVYTLQMALGVELSDLKNFFQGYVPALIPLAIDLIRGLQPLHAASLLSCERKTENIVVYEGFFKHIEHAGLSPHRTNGQLLTQSARTDLFACGLIIVEMATGLRPTLCGACDEHRLDCPECIQCARDFSLHYPRWLQEHLPTHCDFIEELLSGLFNSHVTLEWALAAVAQLEAQNEEVVAYCRHHLFHVCIPFLHRAALLHFA